MPAYKDDKQNSWYCQFYYEDWQGNKKKKKKRGFKTKKEAQEWENSFKVSTNADMDMTLPHGDTCRYWLNVEVLK